MSFVRSHSSWIALFAGALILGVGSSPALDTLRERTTRDLQQIKSERMKTEQNLEQLRENVATAQKLVRQIDRTHAEQILAPVDRLKVAAMLEKEAEAARLSHFYYTLAPEDQVTLSAGGEAQDMAMSLVTLSGDAPNDIAAYNYIEHVRSALPGRALLQEFMLTRKEGLAAQNVHFEASYAWLSNGTLQTLAGNP